MKILQIHNYYQYSGGEDVVLKNEHKLLTSNNHTVIQYLKNNSEITEYSFFQKGKHLLQSSFSRIVYNEVINLLKKEKPDICHVHNTLALITPSVYYACRDCDVPVIQTLHNYRLLCTNALLFRNDKICEECINSNLYHSIKYGCYRNSRIQSFVLAHIIEQHKKRGTWENLIDAYIVLSQFAKNKFIEGGLPEKKFFIKPNFIKSDPGVNHKSYNYLLFVGRIDIAKGIEILIKAYDQLKNKPSLLIAGDGPLKSKVTSIKDISYIGFLGHDQLINKLKDCYILVFPSMWYEGMPMAIVEAFACGKPVIASRLGTMAEMIEDGKTGLLFNPGDAVDLTLKIQWAIDHPEGIKEMGLNARKQYEEKYTAEKNYELLMNIYEHAIENRRRNSL